MNKEEEVINWIQKNYDTTTIDIIDYFLPNSKIVRDKEGIEYLVKWDEDKKEVTQSELK